MDAILFCEILDKTLLPFLKKTFPDEHRYMRDNDLKHVSNMAKKFLSDNNVNWWRTPPESPDANPIEDLWHELKENIQKTKPKTKQELIDAIKAFWKTVDVPKCNRYINHPKKVLPKIVEVEGCATGY